MSKRSRRRSLLICEGVTHALGVKFSDHAPDFAALCIEVNKSGGEFKSIYRREIHADGFLNIEALINEPNAISLSELVHDGLYRYAAYSVGRLEFEQDGFASPDHCLHFFGIIH